MSTLADHMPQGQGGARLNRLADWFVSLRQPITTWSGTQRLAGGVAIASAVFGIGMYAWDAADLGRTSASRAALAAAAQRLSDARSAVKALPALRLETAPVRPLHEGPVGLPIGNWHAISALASRSGLTLSTLEPAKPYGEGLSAARPLHFVARGNFAAALDFLEGLSSLPALAVPADLLVKRDGENLSISMNIAVFDALPSPRSLPAATDLDGDDEDVWFFDPFATEPDVLAGVESTLRLAGVLREGKRGLALLSVADGPTALEMGQWLGGERVTRIDDQGVTLSSNAGMRRLTLAEEGR
jgi:hypothetical protein